MWHATGVDTCAFEKNLKKFKKILKKNLKLKKSKKPQSDI